MTSHNDIYTTTDVNPEMIPGIQSGNGIPHDKCNLRGITHACSNKKDDIFIQRRLYIDEAHTALDILCFAVFLNKCSRYYYIDFARYCHRVLETVNGRSAISHFPLKKEDKNWDLKPMLNISSTDLNVN